MALSHYKIGASSSYLEKDSKFWRYYLLFFDPSQSDLCFGKYPYRKQNWNNFSCFLELKQLLPLLLKLSLNIIASHFSLLLLLSPLNNSTFLPCLFSVTSFFQAHLGTTIAWKQWCLVLESIYSIQFFLFCYIASIFCFTWSFSLFLRLFCQTMLVICLKPHQIC